MEDEKFKHFLESRPLKKNSVRCYARELTLYGESTGLTPTELILQAREDEKKTRHLDERKIQSHLNNHLEWMQDKRYAPYRIKVSIGIIRSFYGEFSIQLPKNRYRGAKPETYYKSVEDLPNAEHIRLAMALADIKWRAIIALMACNGMRLSDIRVLTVYDFYMAMNRKPENGLNTSFDIHQLTDFEPNRIGILDMRSRGRVKTGIPYVTFSTPEANGFILDYLLAYPPTKMDQPLFRSQGTFSKLNESAFHKYFARLNNSAGWMRGKYHNFFTTGTLRKYFSNTLLRNGVSDTYMKLMMGHTLGAVQGVYRQIDISAMLKDYVKAVPELTFMEKIYIQKEGG